jgi:transcriptional regulator with XRE-family HTH domain
MPAAIQPTTKLADSIRRARKRAGYRTQGDLAAAMHVTQSTISLWEVGAGRPDPGLMLLLHDVIDVPLEDYFADLDLEALRTGSIDTLFEAA